MQLSESGSSYAPKDMLAVNMRSTTARELWTRRADQSAALIECLSSRQREVLSEIMHGFLNKQIAHHLGIAEKTVKMHRKLMLERLGVATTAEAVRVGTEACFARATQTSNVAPSHYACAAPNDNARLLQMARA